MNQDGLGFFRLGLTLRLVAALPFRFLAAQSLRFRLLVYGNALFFAACNFSGGLGFRFFTGAPGGFFTHPAEFFCMALAQGLFAGLTLRGFPGFDFLPGAPRCLFTYPF